MVPMNGAGQGQKGRGERGSVCLLVPLFARLFAVVILRFCCCCRCCCFGPASLQIKFRVFLAQKKENVLGEIFSFTAWGGAWILV